MMYLIISLIVIIPMNIGNAFAVDEKFDEGIDTASGETKASVGAKCQVFGPTNPKDSLILSALTLCIPGVVEKLYQLQNIKCEKIVCRYDAAIHGLDDGKCQAKEAYSTCKYIVGDIYNALGLNLFNKIRDWIKQAILDPVGLAYGIGIMLARKQVEKCFLKGATCDTIWIKGLAIVVSVNDAIALYGRISEMFKNKPDFWPDNSCDKLGPIEKELEEIVKVELDEKAKVEEEIAKKQYENNGGEQVENI